MTKTGLTVLAVASTLVLGGMGRANAATVVFSFSFSEPGVGTVTGEVDLSNSTTMVQSASAVILDSFPASLGSICSTPCNTLSSPWIVAFNQFIVTNNNIGFADFLSVLPNNSRLNFVPGLGILQGPNLTAAAGIPTFTETSLPAALPLFASGLGALGLLGWRRKRKSRVSLLGAD